MTYPNFDKNLREGEAREDAFVHVMLRSRVEHKRDHKCLSTGNLAVEYEQRHEDGIVRPSGIATTDADRWAFEFEAEQWMVLTTERVKDLARRAIREGHHKWIGDENNHHNALIPIGWAVPEGIPALQPVAA